jgi:hypothetical protein
MACRLSLLERTTQRLCPPIFWLPVSSHQTAECRAWNTRESASKVNVRGKDDWHKKKWRLQSPSYFTRDLTIEIPGP